MIYSCRCYVPTLIAFRIVSRTTTGSRWRCLQGCGFLTRTSAAAAAALLIIYGPFTELRPGAPHQRIGRRHFLVAGDRGEFRRQRIGDARFEARGQRAAAGRGRQRALEDGDEAGAFPAKTVEHEGGAVQLL